MKPSKPKGGGFFFEREMYQSTAFLTLGKNALKTLVAFMDARKMQNVAPRGQKKRYRCINPDCIKLPYGLLQNTYLIPRGRIPVAIDELLAKGFIEIKHAGGSTKSDLTIYALAENWRLWRPNSKPFSMREPRQHHGYQGRPLGAVAARMERNAHIGHETEPIHTHETGPLTTN